MGKMDSAAFRRWRDRAGITQAGAADKFGVTRRTVTRWEAGVAAIPDSVAVQCDLEQVAAPASKARPGVPPRLAAARDDLANDPRTAAMPRVAADQVDMSLVRPPSDPYWHTSAKPGTIVYRESEWPFPRLADIPRGLYRKIYDIPLVMANGVVICAIDYMSNGVGTPSFVSVGYVGRCMPAPGLEGIQRGAYAPDYGEIGEERAQVTPRKASAPLSTDPAKVAAVRTVMDGVQFGPSRRVSGDRAKRMATLPRQS